MKCISCETEINPKWKHAIISNVCPFCGENIMEEKLKTLFSSFNDIMEKLSSEYSDQLNDWMLSNYNFIKTDSPNLVNFLPKKEEAVKNNKKTEKPDNVRPEREFTSFFKRAIDPNSVKNSSMIKKIKEEAGTIESSADIIGDAGNVDAELISEMKTYISTSRGNEDMESDNSSEQIPNVIMNMAKTAAPGNSSKIPDLLKLQRMQDKIKASRENFESGASRGSGGFSRVG